MFIKLLHFLCVHIDLVGLCPLFSRHVQCVLVVRWRAADLFIKLHALHKHMCMHTDSDVVCSFDAVEAHTTCISNVVESRRSAEIDPDTI